jgi:hypothetical protein
LRLLFTKSVELAGHVTVQELFQPLLDKFGFAPELAAGGMAAA